MRRLGHITILLAAGEARPHVPNHLDCLCGAGRHASHFDLEPVDRTLQRWGGGFRTCCVFHARRSLGRIGSQHLGFNDLEENLGLSRSYRIELAEPEKTDQTVQALRDLTIVEQAAVQTIATAPMTATAVVPVPQPPAVPEQRTVEDSWKPHDRVRAPQALELEPGDERVTVAVVDTGVALGHHELHGKLLAGFDAVDIGMGRIGPKLCLVGDSRGRDFSPRDGTGHGSHVAGIIGAQGCRIPPGAGGRSLILPIRVLAAARLDDKPASKLVGIGALPDIDAGLKVAVDLGADVINMSLGTPESSIGSDTPRPHLAITQYATHFGCVLVAAAGNSGTEERYFPAALPDVIAVGSVEADGRRSEYSTWGDHLSLCAAGSQIVSLGRRGYAISTGTSHAAPFVAGAAALMISRGRRAGRKLQGADVRRLLTETTTSLSADAFDPETGHGLLNMEAALRRFEDDLRNNIPVAKPRGAAV